ncbi:MAG TPA: FG-GAP-like repeat-containing protein, partial [Methylomirabilota bacterium]|nr:FG-GAP-like repeat-containing protein [Methylomirabilota bacterium]
MKTNPFTIIRLAAGRWFVAIVLLSVAMARAAEPTFTNVTDTATPGLSQLGHSSAAWADYDNDGRLDFLLTGVSYYIRQNPDGSETHGGTNTSQLWRNTGSGFTNVTPAVAPGLPGVSGGSVAWGDYNNDGRPDFLLTGSGISQLWRNTGSGFTNVTPTVAPGLPGVRSSSVAWGDYDKDGLLDFLITGHTGYLQPNWVPIFISQVWRNTGTGFTNVTEEVAPGLPGVVEGAVAWADYDNDGRLDFLLTGGIPRRTDQDDDTSLTPISQLWRNTGNGFANVTGTATPGLPGVHWSSVAWADYDNDGRLDFLISGWNRSLYSGVSQLWRNTGNGFVNVTATVAPGLQGLYLSSLAWGDYDNDGRLDFIISGGWSPVSQVWRNTANGFTNVTATVAPGLPGVVDSSLAWGDYNNDGRLDFLLAGARHGYCDGCDNPDTLSQLWQNNTVQTSPPPAVITDPPTDVTQNGVALNARINPRGQVTTAWFVWGTTTNYGQVTAAQPVGNGGSFTDFSTTITGLSPSETYYYRAVGSNEQGLVFLGFEQRFQLSPPFVMTRPGGSMSPTSATFNGQALPNNLPTYGWFEWGLTLNLGEVTPIQFLGSGFNIGFAENLSGLQGSTTYYFRAVASNSFGAKHGSVESLVTPFTDVCPGSISPMSRSHGHSGGPNSVYVLLQCAWNVVNTNSWITITSASNGPGNGPLYYTVAPNPLPQYRIGNITIGGHNYRVTQGAGPASFAVQPPVQTVLGGGTATFTVPVTGVPPYTYQWQFNGVPMADGLGISGATTSNLVLTGVQNSQAGNYRAIVTHSNGAMVGFSSLAQLFVSCGFALSPSNASFSSLSATGQVALSAAAADCPWSILNTNPWVTVFSSIQNKGSGTVTYAVAANPTAVPRTASIRIADQTFTITQAGGATNTTISLAESVDTEGTLSWGTIGAPAWFGQTVLSHDGFDAAQSGPIGDRGAVTMETAVNGPGTLSFWWKISSDTNRHYLKFFINGVQQTRISGETDWQQQTFALSSGRSVLKWTYSKSDYITAGQDRGWLDQVQFVPSSPCNIGLLPTSVTHDSTFSTGFVSISTSPGCVWTAVNTNAWVAIVSHAMGSGNGAFEYLLAENSGAARSGNITVGDQLFTITQLAPSTNAPVSLAEALDTVGTSTWDTIGTPVWFGQKSISHDGVDAAQSGAVGHSAAVTTHTTVEGPGIISFWWKVSSESEKDFLKFFINGVQQTRISGEVNWQLQNFTLPPGEHLLKWTYSKNATRSVGLDRGWVDQVRFLAGVNPCGVLLSNMGAIHSSSVETGAVNLLGAAEGCKWNVSTTTSWITLLPSDTSGSIPYRLSQNYSLTDRTGVIGINDHIFTVVQRG